jgi:hypothetical protein
MPSHRPNTDFVRVPVRVAKTGKRCGAGVCQGCLGFQGIFDSTDIFSGVLVFYTPELQNYSVRLSAHNHSFFIPSISTLTTLTTLTKIGNIRAKPSQGSDFHPDTPLTRNEQIGRH